MYHLLSVLTYFSAVGTAPGWQRSKVQSVDLLRMLILCSHSTCLFLSSLRDSEEKMVRMCVLYLVASMLYLSIQSVKLLC